MGYGTVGVNRVIMVGYVHSFELKHPQNLDILEVSLAVRRYNHELDFFKLSFIGEQALELNGKAYIGAELYVEGSLRITPYTSRAGERKLNIQVLCHKHQLITGVPEELDWSPEEEARLFANTVWFDEGD